VNAHAGETIIGIVEADTFVEHEIVRSNVMESINREDGARSDSRALWKRM